jgi:adenylate cyclase
MSAVAVRRLRLGSGLVLFAYVTTHLLNHALGLVSLEAMEAGRLWFLALWRSRLGTAALYGALLTHVLLAFWSLYRRRHLRMPAWEATQLGLGLVIPPLLISHIVGTRLASTLYDALDSYQRVVLTLWQLSPQHGLRQALVLVIAWVHGCIGLHFWLRLVSGYRRVSLPLFALALLVPTLALLGFAQAGREAGRLAGDPAWAEAVTRGPRVPGPAQAARLQDIRDTIAAAYWLALGSVFLARGIRGAYQRRHRSLRITYPGGREVTVPRGFTVLEASRLAGIPHASVCGGRGRCSTCRVRVTHGLRRQPPPAEAERRVLERVRAQGDVRLACQLRPSADLSVAPMLPAAVGPGMAGAPYDPDTGREREIAILFADLRGFTRLAEPRLPFDVVFFLNRYFETMGRAIERSGGIANQFTGDGVMALFGVDSGPAAGARQALAAAQAMVDGLAGLGRDLADELPTPLRLGIGIHVGPAVVGRMGYGQGVYLTAVGDTVHVASRLESLTKEYDCELVVSEEVVARAGLDGEPFARHEVTVRNREAPLAIRVIPRAADLPWRVP